MAHTIDHDRCNSPQRTLKKLLDPIWKIILWLICVSVRAVLFCEPSIKGAARDRVFFFAWIKAEHSSQIAALNEELIGSLCVLLGPCVFQIPSRRHGSAPPSLSSGLSFSVGLVCHQCAGGCRGMFISSVLERKPQSNLPGVRGNAVFWLPAARSRRRRVQRLGRRTGERPPTRPAGRLPAP